MQLLNILLAVVLTLAPLSSYQQARIPGPGGAGSGGGGGGTGSFTGQTCVTSAASSGSATIPCPGTFTVSLGDIVIVFGTFGNSAATLSSCSTATGTATVSWSVIAAASGANDGGANEVEGMCIGNTTGAGTVEPQMTWSAGTGDNSIIAAAFSSLTATQDGAQKATNLGSTGTNGNTSGTFTTTVNLDTIVSGFADTRGNAATITAGTTSATFTKIGTCTTTWGGQTCLEWGNQTTAGVGTVAAWTSSVSEENLVAAVAIEHN